MRFWPGVAEMQRGIGPLTEMAECGAAAIDRRWPDTVSGHPRSLIGKKTGELAAGFETWHWACDGGAGLRCRARSAAAWMGTHAGKAVLQ